jgi:hypothetical protein
MRSDMGKVLTERPRAGSRYSRIRNPEKNIDYMDEDAAPMKRDLTPGRKYSGRKVFSDLLGPLYGFLCNAVGRPWDDVYSEICKTIPGTGTLALHIRQHFEWAVETKPYIKADGPYTADGRYPLYSSGRRPSFYVDSSGTLCAAPRVKRDRPPLQSEVHVVDGRAYKQIGNIWYEAVLAEHNLVPYQACLQRTCRYSDVSGITYPVMYTEYPVVSDHIFGYAEINRLAQKYGIPGVHCVKKRQLNTKQKERLLAALAEREAASKA